MKLFATVMVCLLCMLVGLFLGAFLVDLGGTAATAEVIKCSKDPESCGMDADDLDPPERLIPA